MASQKVRITQDGSGNGVLIFSDAAGDFGTGTEFARIKCTSANTLTFEGSASGAKAILSGMQTGTSADSLATKEYVDTAALTGVTTFAPVLGASTAALSNATFDQDGAGSYAPGTIVCSAVPNTVFSETGLDDTTASEIGVRYLVKNESDAAYNGIYQVTSKTSDTNYTLTRADDMKNGRDVVPNRVVFVQDGGTNADKQFMLSANITLRTLGGTTTPSTVSGAHSVGDTTITLDTAMSGTMDTTSAYTNFTALWRDTGVKIGNFWYQTTTSDQNSGTTLTLTTGLLEALSGGEAIFVGTALSAADGTDSTGRIDPNFMTFAEFGGGGTTYTAGAGLTDTSNTFAVANATNGGIAVTADAIAVDLDDLAAGVVDVAADSIAIIDADDNNSKKESIADLVAGIADASTITASNGQLTVANVTVGTTAIAPGAPSTTTIAGLTSLTGDAAGLSLVAAGSDQDVRVTPTGTGAVVVGTGAAAGVVESSGNFNLTLRTGNATTGSIGIVDGANGNFEMFPNGTGKIVVGGSAPTVTAIAGGALTLSTTSGNTNVSIVPHGTGDVLLDTDNVQIGGSGEDVTVTTNGTGDLTLNTNGGTNSGSIVIADGAAGAVTISTDSDGLITLHSGNGNIELDAGTGDIVCGDGTNAPTIYSDGAVNLEIGCDTNNKLIFNDSGSKATFSASIEVEGEEFTATSDLRLKNLKGRIQDAGAKLDKINGYNFEWKASGRKSAGCGAQEVEAVLGEWAVRTVQDDTVGDKKLLQYNGVIALLVEALKETRAEVAALKGQVCKCKCKPDCCQ